MANAKRDQNRITNALLSNDSGVTQRLKVDNITNRVLVSLYSMNTPSSTTLNTFTKDSNKQNTALGIQDDGTVTPLHIDNRNGYLFCDVNVE